MRNSIDDQISFSISSCKFQICKSSCRSAFPCAFSNMRGIFRSQGNPLFFHALSHHLHESFQCVYSNLGGDLQNNHKQDTQNSCPILLVLTGCSFTPIGRMNWNHAILVTLNFISRVTSFRTASFPTLLKTFEYFFVAGSALCFSEREMGNDFQK